MAEEGKKISFGFSKSIKKTVLQNVPAPAVQKKVDYIECLDNKSIKIVGGEEKKDELLVIPMLGTKTWHDRIINKVNVDIFANPKSTEPKIKDEPMEIVQIKQEKVDDHDVPNGDISNENNIQPTVPSVEIKKELEEDKPLTLEEQAAREILSDLNSSENKSKEEVFTVPVTQDEDVKGKEQSTLEDYEKIPIDAFGMAMLRGMGWQPGKGIGKNEKIVPPAIPELRPKGMGLGADKLAVQKIKGNIKKEEQLKLVIGGYVRIIAGKHSDNYGKIEGFDEDTGRIILKLAIGGEAISVNEVLVQPVTSSEYSENSKVLNAKTYKEYKSNEIKKSDKSEHESSKSADESDDKNYKSRRDEKSRKKSKKGRHQSSDEDNSVDRKSRKRRVSSSSSDEDQKQKKSKKSKKHKSRDSSAERSSRKNRKKDKEREKTRHKKSDYSDPSERARHKNRRKSRSRSYSPKKRKRV